MCSEKDIDVPKVSEACISLSQDRSQTDRVAGKPSEREGWPDGVDGGASVLDCF